MRRRQWKRWLDNILDRTLADFVKGKGSKTLVLSLNQALVKIFINR